MLAQLSAREVEILYGSGPTSEPERDWVDARRARGVSLTGVYVFKVADDIFIDPEDLECANWTRYLNHADHPNVAMKTLPRSYTGKPRVWAVALRDIEAGEEICFRYADTYWLPGDEVL